MEVGDREFKTVYREVFKFAKTNFTSEYILSDYYMDLYSFSKQSGHYKLVSYDDRGIPVVRYNPPVGLRYNPVTVALEALISYQQRAYHKFLNYTTWLLEHSHLYDGKRFLYYDFPVPPKVPSSHWVSGMAQGLATSVIVRQYILSGDKKYLRYAEEFINGMLTPISKGGCLFAEGENIWIEEYPTQRPPRHVLNGLIYAVLGLHDVILVTQKNIYQIFFRRIINTIEKNIHLYDLYLWSRYDISILSIAPKKYHLLNTVLLYIVAMLVRSEKLLETTRRWALGYAIYESFTRNTYAKTGIREMKKFVARQIHNFKASRLFL
jgi:hypothetical protein